MIQTLCRFLPLLEGRCRTTSFQAPALLCRIRAQARERGCDFGFYLPLRYCARQIACLSSPSLYRLPGSKWTPLLFPFHISQWTRQYPIYPASSCSQLFQTRSEAYRRLSSTRRARRFRTCQEPEGPGYQSSLPRRLNLKTEGFKKGPQRSFQSVMASVETIASYRPPFRLSPTSLACGFKKGPQRSFQTVMASVETVASYSPPFRLSPTSLACLLAARSSELASFWFLDLIILHCIILIGVVLVHSPACFVALLSVSSSEASIPSVRPTQCGTLLCRQLGQMRCSYYLDEQIF